MMNYNRLAMSIAAAAACLAYAGAASATAITLVPTSSLQSYTTLAKDTITFDFDATVPSDLTYGKFLGTFQVDGVTVGPFSGISSYAVPGFVATGITVQYQLTPTVPETATWAMMLIGLGAIGFAVRRRPNVSLTYA